MRTQPLEQATAIRSTHHPLTLEQIQRVAPSAFATEPYHGMSSRYAYIPTSTVIDGLMKAGFQPFAAAQSRARLDDKKAHTKHMIRFRAPNTTLALGETFPEIVLVNSHDGSSAYKLMAGLFRLVCSNGMIVADSLVGSISVRHTGNVIEEAASGSIQIVERMPVVVDAIARWKSIQLSAGEQAILADAAHHLKFADTDGKITTPIKPEQLLAPRRSEDSSPDLWSTFNRVQENLTKGGLTARQPYDVEHHRRGRRVTTQGVRAIDQDVKLNRALWTISEKMAEMKG